MPRAGLVQLAKRAEIARNTAQAHLDRMIAAGVIVGFGPEIDLGRVGYAVSAIVSLEIAQGRRGTIDEHLVTIPEIVEAWMTTGSSDLLCRVVARDNDHLGRVIAEILEVPGVTRTTTSLLLSTPIAPRSSPSRHARRPPRRVREPFVLERDPVVLEQEDGLRRADRHHRLQSFEHDVS